MICNWPALGMFSARFSATTLPSESFSSPLPLMDSPAMLTDKFRCADDTCWMPASSLCARPETVEGVEELELLGPLPPLLLALPVDGLPVPLTVDEEHAAM